MMPVQFADARQRAFDNMLAKDKIRLRDPATGDLLHMSGQGTTRDVTWSWLGFGYQADTLRSSAAMRGEDWPFEAVHRDLLEPVLEVEANAQT